MMSIIYSFYLLSGSRDSRRKMAYHEKKLIKNLLDIKYDLATNTIEGVTTSPDQLSETSYVLYLWQKHIVQKLLSIPFGDPEPDIRVYQRWFRSIGDIFGNVQVINGDVFARVLKMAPYIGSQILNFFEILSDFDCLKKSELICFIMNLKATSYATIDNIKAATFLVERTGFETSKKFSMACYFCFYKKLIASYKDHILYHEFEFFADDVLRSEMFWVFTLSGKSKDLNKLLKLRFEINETNNKHLLLWAISRENEIAVQYFWEKVYEENQSIDLIETVTYALNFKSTNILCFLISKMNSAEQIKSLYLNEGYEILSKLDKDIRWSNHFPKAENCVLQFISEMDFKNALKIIILCWRRDESRRNIYNEFLNNFIVRFRVNINIDFVFSSSLILSTLLAVEDEEIARSLLRFENIQEIEIIINQLCLELIDRNSFDLLVQLLENVLDKDVGEYKTQFFKEYESIILSKLITNNKFDMLDKLLIYFLEEEVTCRVIKSELPYKDQGELVADMLKEDRPSIQNEVTIDRFLMWCFNGDVENIANCHKALFDIKSNEYAHCRDKFANIVKQLMNNKKFEQLEEFFNWAFSDRITLTSNTITSPLITANTITFPSITESTIPFPPITESTSTSSLKNYVKKYETIAFALKN